MTRRWAGWLPSFRPSFDKCVVDLTIEGNNVTAEREIEGGKEIVTSTLPVVICAQRLNDPRYPQSERYNAGKIKAN
jgi:electron transfer flavoprotein beta subunit